jgi:F-type H+-transporting ATPase subunit delta
MIFGSLARRYSRALVKIGQETQTMQEIGKELAKFVEIFPREKELQEALTGPVLKRDVKDEIITNICKQLGMSDLMTSFLRLLNEKGRMEYLERIAIAYQDMADQAQAVARAQVTAADALTEEQTEQVRDTLARISGKQVIMELQQDPGIIGGLVIRMEGLLLDGSIKRQLDKIREQMTKEVWEK